jgi:DNA-3-methyladenine glycosylase
VMFGPPGHAYVYFTYGMHFCMNVVCMPAGTASAVLLRAGEVVAGEDLARRRRAAHGQGAEAGAARDLARGPARLCQALEIDRSLDGADFCDPASPLRLRGGDATVRSEKKIVIHTGPRVGVREAAEVPWRFWLDGEPTVSVYRAHMPRSARPGKGLAQRVRPGGQPACLGGRPQTPHYPTAGGLPRRTRFRGITTCCTVVTIHVSRQAHPPVVSLLASGDDPRPRHYPTAGGLPRRTRFRGITTVARSL